MSIKRDIRHSRQRALERLLALRDEARVQVHLLSLDARRAFDDLETQVAALEARANAEGEQAFEALKATTQELTRALNVFMTTHVNASVGLLTSARSLMSTHVVTCQGDDSLSDAAHLMWNADCGMVPVLGEQRPIGVITDRDVCMAAYIQGKPLGEMRVDSAMSQQLHTCAADDSLTDVLEVMRDKQVRRLPVVSAEGKLLGVVSLADVLRWAQPLDNPSVDAALTETLAAISSRAPHTLASAAE